MKYIRQIFVFGSDLAGIHGAGAAREAFRSHGALFGERGGVGFHGNSYAIPTKDRSLRVLPPHRIEPFVHAFLDFAKDHPTWQFNVAAVGCGVAGYKPDQIAPMFHGAPSNCVFTKEFLNFLTGKVHHAAEA